MVHWVKRDSGAQGISSLGKVLGEVIGTYGQQRANKKYGTILDEVMEDLPEDAEGDDYSKAMLKAVSKGVPFNMAQDFLKTRTQLTKESPAQIKRDEKFNMLQGALNTIGEIEGLLEGGNIGTKLGFPVDLTKQFGQSGIDRAKMKQLGKSLIQTVSRGIPIRNQKEFEEFKETITDPTARSENIVGAIQGLKGLISNELELASKGKRKNTSAVSSRGPEIIEETKETVKFRTPKGVFNIPIELKERFIAEYKG